MRRLKQPKPLGKRRLDRLPHRRVGFLSTLDCVEHLVALSHGSAEFAFEGVGFIAPVVVVGEIVGLSIERTERDEFEPLAVIEADAFFVQVPTQRIRVLVWTQVGADARERRARQLRSAPARSLSARRGFSLVATYKKSIPDDRLIRRPGPR